MHNDGKQIRHRLSKEEEKVLSEKILQLYDEGFDLSSISIFLNKRPDCIKRLFIKLQVTIQSPQILAQNPPHPV